MKLECERKIREAIQTASKYYGKDIPVPKIRWSNRMTKCAGTATFIPCGKTTRTKDIALSVKLLELNGKVFVEETPVHEAAHVIAVEVFGWDEGKGHGRRWKEVMKLLGQEPSRLHTMKVA